jgi:ribonuclease HI
MHKQLKFDSITAKKIKEGLVNWTWRFFDDKAISVGDRIELIEVDSQKLSVFDTATVVEIEEKYLKDFYDLKMIKYLGLTSREELVNQAKNYYRKIIDDKSIIKLVHLTHSRNSTLAQTTNNKIVTYNYAKIFTDGGSRGNPGPAASGYVLLSIDDTIITKNGIYLGVTTNNQAEYRALQFAVKEAVILGIKDIDIYMDSMLIVNQMKGLYKIKNTDLIPIFQDIKERLQLFSSYSFTHVPRALNKLADYEVNKALDNATAKN